MGSQLARPSSVEQTQWLTSEFEEFRLLAANLESLTAVTLRVSQVIIDCIDRGNKVMFCGNGGSAGDAQHLATELVGRQNYARGSLPGLALTTDTSCLTALANDDGYDTVFSRQVEALGKPGDVLVGISTSGKSVNVLRAIQAASAMGITTVGFCGQETSPLHDAADIAVAIPSSKTAHIQEGHITIGQMICGLVERAMFPKMNDCES